MIRLRGIAVMATMLTVSGCGTLFFDPPTELSSEEIYAELWTAFAEGYAPFEERGVDWLAARNRHAPAAGADEASLHAAATSLLAELDDGHVTLSAPGRPLFVAKQTFRDAAFDGDLNLGLIFQQMTEGPITTGAARYGVLPGDIGYVHVANWSEEVPGLDVMMEFFRERAAVIVDLRHNPGGDFTNGFPVAARFAAEERLAFTTYTKTGPGAADIGQVTEWRIGPAGPFQFTGPVVVLTNGYTNSAAERTLMAFRTMDHVTTIGSVTAGNHGEKVGGELSNGWGYSIVPQVVVAADGVSYEGPGLPPDVLVGNSAEEIADGIDRQFDEALEVLEDRLRSR